MSLPRSVASRPASSGERTRVLHRANSLPTKLAEASPKTKSLFWFRPTMGGDDVTPGFYRPRRNSRRALATRAKERRTSESKPALTRGELEILVGRRHPSEEGADAAATSDEGSGSSFEEEGNEDLLGLNFL